MKKILVLWLILLSTITYAQQTNRFSLSWGFGYFADISQFLRPGFGAVPHWHETNPKVYGKVVNGNNLLANASMKLRSGFNLNIGIVKATTTTYFNDPFGLYWDTQTKENYSIFHIGFSRNLINENSRFAIVPIVSLKYQIFTEHSVNYENWYYIRNGVRYIYHGLPEFTTRQMHDAGLMLSNKVLYEFRNIPIEIGLKKFSYFLLGIGVEAISVTPIIKFNL